MKDVPSNSIVTAGIPEIGFLRVSDAVGKGKPIPVSRSTYYEGVKSGRFPAPVRISEKCSALRVEDVRRFIRTVGGETK